MYWNIKWAFNVIEFPHYFIIYKANKRFLTAKSEAKRLLNEANSGIEDIDEETREALQEVYFIIIFRDLDYFSCIIENLLININIAAYKNESRRIGRCTCEWSC